MVGVAVQIVRPQAVSTMAPKMKEEEEALNRLLSATDKNGKPVIQSALEFLNKEKSGKNCLHAAAEAGQTQIIKDLLTLDRHSRMVRAVDSNGQTALHNAAYWGHAEAVQILASAQPGLIYAKDGHLHRTCLHFAAALGELEVVDWLAARGGQKLILAQDKNGKTSLDIATQEARELLQAHLSDRETRANSR